MDDLFEYQPEADLNNSSQPAPEELWHESLDCGEEEEHQPDPQEDNQPNDLSNDAIKEQLIPSTLENERQQEAPTIKENSHGKPVKSKSRLCVQGFNKIQGTDFDKTYAPTGKIYTLRTIPLYTIHKHLNVLQFDVQGAFLHASLSKEVFIRTPKGSNRKFPYLKLKKALYGLKQEPKNWYETLTGWLESVGFHKSGCDPSSDDNQKHFKKLNINYRSAIGLMNYIASNTRPDLSFVVSSLARYLVKPGLTHWKEVKKVWQYIRRTQDLKLTLQVKDRNSFLNIYSDTTWGDDPDSRTSQSTWLKSLINEIWNLQIESALHFIDDSKLNDQLTVDDQTFKELYCTTHFIDNKGLNNKLKKFGSNSKT
ncbi:hypothetical protein PCANC_10125 [Puccinia coronata f. sp. avenae]|uniref:Reverse transcriptase Ty1/copia-type domain-containing protein n=1 Tax=Puccinia coronata f. sp. avenae TaxID=200324 RepID=A0A2N5V6B5_9BASI|nr:hypothetical protein PCANC_10125 [Puccinia coronata f. sp. avenae]